MRGWAVWWLITWLFKFFKFFFYFKLASKLAHRLQRERLMYFLRVESRDWIHSRTSRKGWKNLTNGYLTNDERIWQYLQTKRSESGPKITANPIVSRLREHMKKIELIFFKRTVRIRIYYWSFQKAILKNCEFYLFPPSRQ